MGRIKKQQQEREQQEQTPITKKAKKIPIKRPVRRRDDDSSEEEGEVVTDTRTMHPPTHKRGRLGQQHQHDDGSSSDTAASASESDLSSSSDDDDSGAGKKKKKAPRSFTWHKGKGKGKTTKQQRPGGRKLAVASSEEEEEESASSHSGSGSKSDGVSSRTPARRRLALGSSSTKGKKGAKGDGGHKQQQQRQAESEEESEESESEEETVVKRKPIGKSKGKASGKKGAAGAVTPLLLPLSDEEEEKEVKKTKGKKTGSKRKAPIGGKGEKEQKTGSKKAKKTKVAAPDGEEGEQLSAIEQLCGNAELFNDLFLATGIIGSVADVVHLGSTCKAFEELRAAPSVVDIDLMEASNTLRFPNRFIRSLARPGNRLEVLSVKNAFTGEMCRNLSEVLTSGHLPHLEELDFIQGCEALGSTFSSLVSADLPSLRHLGLKHTKIAAEYYKPLTEKSKALTTPVPRKGTLGLKRKKAAKVAGGPLLSLEGLSLINLKIPDTALTAWVQGLASNRASLQHLELVGVLPHKYQNHAIIDALKDGSFPHLHTLVLDNRRLSATDAAAIIHGCGAHLHGLRTLVLANKQGKLGHYYGANHGASAAAIVKALEEEAADEESALQALESLSIGWGTDQEAIDAFLTLIFEGVVYGVEDGGEDKITKKKKKKKTKALPFPNLTSIGLIEMTGIVNTQRAKTVIENALRRGITRVDFSFNELSPSAVGEVVQRASDLLLQAAAAYHPGQAPSLFLQMRQFTRRWKSGYRHHSRWMVARRQLRTHLDSVLKALPDDLAEGLEVDIGESETREHDA